MTQPFEWLRVGVVLIDRIRIQFRIGGASWRHTRPHWFTLGLMAVHDAQKTLAEYEYATAWISLVMFSFNLDFSVPESWRMQPPPRSYRARPWWSWVHGRGWDRNASVTGGNSWAFRVSL